MDDLEVKTDCNGWKFYDRLPDGYRLGKMEDLHIRGRKKVGMKYLIKRGGQEHYEIHHITENTRSINLKPFLDHEMVFISSN
ncbi:MAG: hypothetical protein WCI71_16860 [Bacteroidota bacterium]